ncbi:MAG: alpha/beta fold hydrolase [Cytophaga sp.]|uniref:alpha/beta fold hydrolase n=1 Tax=Cytophaga sp. TaxID=29535 RepID=UPI003F7E86D9
MKTSSGYNLTTIINNIPLAYDDTGTGDVPLIFLHGYPFDRTMWKNQFEYFKSVTRVIAPDLRGFGGSKDEETSLNIDLFTVDLIAFMDKLRIRKAILCGLSMGGYIALNAIKRFPDRFEALILCDTQCIADTAEAKEKRYASIEAIKANGSDTFIKDFIKKIFHPDSFRTKKEVIGGLHQVMSAHSDKILIAGLKALAERSETCSALHNINAPTLILCGDGDQVTPVTKSEMLNNDIQGSVFRVIEKAGHVSNLEQPETFNTHILYFLNALNTIEQLNEKQVGIN